MPLPQPILDDRSYQQLRDELVRRIPIYTPEWTDHNASDPGITLIELFSFLGENLLFRFNQIPEATRLAFLQLLQIPLRPAAPARALLCIGSEDPAGTLVPQGSPASAGDLGFETLSEVRAYPFDVIAVAKAPAEAPGPDTEEEDYTQAAIDAAELKPEERPAYYRNQLVAEDPMKPDAVPVDFGHAVDRMLWVAIVQRPGLTDLTQLQGHVLNLGFALDEQVTGLADVEAPCPGDGSARGTPETVWEYSTRLLDPASGEPVFRPLLVEGDTTASLTQQGVVRLKLPTGVELGVSAPADADLLGARSFPPALEDEELAANVLFWIRAWRRKPSDRALPRLTWVGGNATEVVQTRKALTSFLGTGTGQPHQEYRLVHRPVIAGSLVLQVEEAGQFKPWREVAGFEASTESSPHYVLDAEAGTVRFGNVVKGRAPQLGERIRALEYRYGGTARGNVKARAIDKLDSHAQLQAFNPLPARGGADAEKVSEALDRVPGELRRRERAVTASDFQELALATPGANVVRAETLPLFHPPSKSRRAAGVVSVVVWPREDRAHPDAPRPDRTLLREVCTFLDARRLITTELWVIPPEYRKVAVSVGLQVKPGFGVEAVRAWVERVLRQYLAPLPPYGPEGSGWPLGRQVIGRELEAAALQVEGVQFLTDGVKVARWEEEAQAWRPGDVVLEAWEVPELTQLTVVEGPPLPPGEALTPPPQAGVPVPIPTLKEEC